MAISPSVTAAVKKFSGKPLGIASKALGVASVAALVYDAHMNGKERAIIKDQKDSTDRFMRQYQQYRVSDSESTVVCNLKKLWFDIEQGFPFYQPVSRASGYLEGATKTVVKNLPVVGLSAVALKSKTWVGKAAGVGLALTGLSTLLFDVFGIGNKS